MTWGTSRYDRADHGLRPSTSPRRNLVDRVASDAKKFRTLTADEMFRILDYECRDRHLWALALYGLRRGEISGLRWRNVNLTDKPGFLSGQSWWRRTGSRWGVRL
jgi:integrase